MAPTAEPNCSSKNLGLNAQSTLIADLGVARGVAPPDGEEACSLPPREVRQGRLSRPPGTFNVQGICTRNHFEVGES